MPAGERPSRGWVDHHRDVDVVETTLADERNLPTAALLGGRTDRRQGARELIHDGPHAHRGGDTDHRDEIVAAGVADLGQGVVLLEDRDGRSRAAALRVAAIRGLDVLVTALDDEPSALEKLGDPDRSLTLLVRELRLRVDRAREGEERVAALVDGFDRALCERFRIAHVAAWCPAMSARMTRSSARSASSKRSAACSEARPRRRATFAISAMNRARKKRKACVPSPSESPWRRASTPYSRPSVSACAMS